MTTYHPTESSLLDAFLDIVKRGGRPSRISTVDGRLRAFTYQKKRHMAWSHACLSPEFLPDELPRRLAEIAARLDLEMDRAPRRVGDVASAIVVRAMAGDAYQHKGTRKPGEPRPMEQMALDAGYAARAELFQRRTSRMDLSQWDLASAFPGVALGAIPVGPLVLSPAEHAEMEGYADLWLCDVVGNRTRNEQIAALPYRSQRGTIFPHGRFSGLFWEPEIQAAERAGCEVRRKRLWRCRTSERLAWTMRKLIALRGDEELGRLSKQIANVAIGKLRSKNSREVYAFDPPSKVGWTMIDEHTGLFSKKTHMKRPPPTYCPQAWGYVQAVVRAQLLDQLMMTFEPVTCYADMVLGAGVEPISGQWRCKGRYPGAVFAGRAAGSWALASEDQQIVSRWQGLMGSLEPGQTLTQVITPGLGNALKRGIGTREASAPTLKQLALCDAPIWGRRTVKRESETHPIILGEDVDAGMRY